MNNTKLIELKDDGVYVEVTASDDIARPCAASLAERVNGALEKIQPVLKKMIEVGTTFVKDQVQNSNVSEIVLELGLGFEAEGNIYITKTTAKANLKVKIKIER